MIFMQIHSSLLQTIPTLYAAGEGCTKNDDLLNGSIKAEVKLENGGWNGT